MPKVVKKIVATEDQEQIALFEWLFKTHRDIYAVTFHIPNGGSRNVIEAAKLKRMGVKAGVPDIFVAKMGKFVKGNEVFYQGGLWIELKRKKGGKSEPKITKKQQEWITLLNVAGYTVAVCYGWEEASKVIEEYIKPLVPTNVEIDDDKAFAEEVEFIERGNSLDG